MNVITENLQVVSLVLASIAGYVGVSIMAYGTLKCGLHFIITTIKRNNHLPEIRIDLGKHLALGLEFLVGKDIIESIIRPSWDDLGKLAVIILLRTFVTAMLGWELKQLKKEVREERDKG